MSNKRIASKLEGFDTQRFPPWLHIFNEAYDRGLDDQVMLYEIGRKTPGYIDCGAPTTIDEDTGDKCYWFFAMYFRTMEGEIATLFPWANDYDRKDGTRMERSIAIHTKGDVREEELDKVLKNMYEGFFSLETLFSLETFFSLGKRRKGKRAEIFKFLQSQEIPDLHDGYYLIR